MKFDITLADLVLVDEETDKEICTLAELLPDENDIPVDPYVEVPELPRWVQPWMLHKTDCELDEDIDDIDGLYEE